MSAKGFVYSGKADMDLLRALLRGLKGQVVCFTWDLSTIYPCMGVPHELRDNGFAFDNRCEIRWKRIKEGFQVWVLSDEAIDMEPLEPVEGDWEIKDGKTYLVPLSDRRFHPPFDRYPLVNGEKAVLSCRIFYRNGVLTFISPREVLHHEET